MAVKKNISVSEMARICQVTTETIRKWIDLGFIPSIRTMGGHRRVAYSTFIKFLKSNDLGIEAPELFRNRKILVVSKKEHTFNLLQDFISKTALDVSVEAVQSSFEAGYKVASTNPDIIVFCTDTGGLDIPSACSVIRRDHSSKRVRLVGICGKSTTSSMEFVGEGKLDVLLSEPLAPTKVRRIFF